MPYVITATRVAERDFEGEPLHTITRRAVATLDEAREAVDKIVVHLCDDPYPAQKQSMDLPDSGGTIGPLPDGTMIEVTPISWASIMSAQMIEVSAYEAAIDAYNSFEALQRRSSGPAPR